MPAKHPRSVLVAHPGQQHSHQLALALHEAGLLKAYWAGMPVRCGPIPLKYQMLGGLAQRVRQVDIPDSFRLHPWYFQAVLKAGLGASKWHFSGIRADDFTHKLFHAFDAWTAHRVAELKPALVVAFENSALQTFQAAKKVGARCVLDAPAFEHAAASAALGATPEGFTLTVNARKDREVELADVVLTCSTIARETYVAAGVNREKVLSMPLGAAPPVSVVAWEPHDGPIRFVFAGALRSLKSIDLILQVFSRLHSNGFEFALTFIGGEVEAGWVEQIRKVPCAHYLGQVSQHELFDQLAQSDCLLLPSRFESFGMVVAEGMACGTPAIVSTRTGAKMIIEKYVGAGWIVECDENLLYECIKARIVNRSELFASRAISLEASKEFTWDSYRKRVSSVIAEQLSYLSPSA